MCVLVWGVGVGGVFFCRDGVKCWGSFVNAELSFARQFVRWL